MKKQAILITGGSGEIGSRIAEVISSSERIVFVNYCHNQDKAYQVVDAIKEKGGDAFALKADITNKNEVSHMFQAIDDISQGLDVLINNAVAGLVQKNVLKMEWEDFQHQIDVQLKGTLYCCQEALRRMKNKKSGHIISILSSYVIGAPGGNFSNYITAKYGQMGFMKCLGVEAARFGVRVNMISPSLAKTKLVSLLPDRLFEILEEQNPLGRLCTVDDIANAVNTMMSNDMSFLNLANIPLNGGSVL